MRHGTTRWVWLLAVMAFPTSHSPAGQDGSGENARTSHGTSTTVLPDDRLGIRTAPLLLLTRPDVRADVGLDARQAAEAIREVAELRTRAAALRGRPDAEVSAARRAIDESQRVWLEQRLSTVQRDRLVQVDLQWEGPSALVSRPLVADTLELTSAQREAIGQAVAHHAQARDRAGGARVGEAVLSRKVLELLSPVQRDRWKAMLGRPFVPGLAGDRAETPR